MAGSEFKYAMGAAEAKAKEVHTYRRVTYIRG
jgi:hypothetical protein